MNLGIFVAFVMGLHFANSLVVVNTGNSRRSKRNVPPPQNGPTAQADITAFHVTSDIVYRYAITKVSSQVVNTDENRGKEVTFSVVLPDTAFVSKFVMVMDGVSFEAYVKEKEVARQTYEQAKNDGISAGLVEKRAKHSEIFTINIHIASDSTVTFHLHYEELLKRKFGRYQHVINVNPEQVQSISDYRITVNIAESQDLNFVHVPGGIQQGSSEINLPEGCKGFTMDRPAKNQATISWAPCPVTNGENPSKQDFVSQISSYQVYYDVDRIAGKSEVLFADGYFVHFFVPEDTQPLRKHVVFVLDVSGSMEGESMEQLKQAQKSILQDMTEDDYFNIITFSSTVSTRNQKVVTNGKTSYIPIAATPENILATESYIDDLRAGGMTNIYDALAEALTLSSSVQGENAATSGNWHSLPPNTQSMIVFLTDGYPNMGKITNTNEIIKYISLFNTRKLPIYSLAFGDSADTNFLRKLSLQNNGFTRKIYALSDAPLQLQGFYSELSSPSLSNITFSYSVENKTLLNITSGNFPFVFSGTELAVAGKLMQKQATVPLSDKGTLTPTVSKPEATVTSPGEVTTATRPVNSAPGSTTQPALHNTPVMSASETTTQSSLHTIPVMSTPPETPENTPPSDVNTAPETETSLQDSTLSSPTMVSTPMTVTLPSDSLPEAKKVPSFPVYSVLNLMSTPEPSPATCVSIEMIGKGRNGALESRNALCRDSHLQSTMSHGNTLERLWAYLTVQQLIDQLISFDGSGKTLEESDIRNRATSLAIRYGFVTSLTSLVVLQPNCKDIGNINLNEAVHHYCYKLRLEEHRIAEAMLLEQFQNTMQYQTIMVPGSGAIYPTQHREVPHYKLPQHSVDMSPMNPEDVFDAQTNVFGYIHSSTTPATTTTGRPQMATNLTLDEVTWIRHKQRGIFVNGTQYLIARKKMSNDNQGYECNVESKIGRCVHLRTCILQLFITDETVFRNDYFCSIESRLKAKYVGTCCAL